MRLDEITNGFKHEMLENGLYRDEYIQHGWLKDQAAKVHKYIERWRGKNGKWYYRYKSKAQELKTKINRKVNNETGMAYYPEDITTNYGKKSLFVSGRRNWNGKPKSRLDGQIGSRVNEGTRAGRRRAGLKVRSPKNEYKRQDTAYRYIAKRQQKMSDKVNKVNKSIRDIDEKINTLKYEASVRKQEVGQRLLKTPQQRHKARMQEKELNNKIKKLRKRRNKLNESINGVGSLGKYHKNYSAYSTWNR